MRWAFVQFMRILQSISPGFGIILAWLLRKLITGRVALLNHNRLAAYLVPVEIFESIMKTFENAGSGEIVHQR